MDDPWGNAEQLNIESELLDLPLPATDTRWGNWPEPGLWPEVAALRARGWTLMHPAPLYYLLPAAWPKQHLAWLPDRRWTRYAPNDADFAKDLTDEADYVDSLAAAVGLPKQPRGRLWFLRSPWPQIPVSAIYNLLGDVMNERRDHQAAAFNAATTIFAWTEDEAFDSLPTETRELIKAWASLGRVGAEADDVIDAEVTPETLRTAIATTTLTEPELLSWSSILNHPIDDVLLDFVTRWLAAGLPANPEVPEIDLDEDIDAHTLRRLRNEE